MGGDQTRQNYTRCGTLNLISQVGAATYRTPRRAEEQLPVHIELAQDRISSAEPPGRSSEERTMFPPVTSNS